MSKKVLEIVRGIAQAAADIGYDGCVDDDGKPVEIGLKREEGHPIYNSRVMDGFNIGFAGPNLILSYMSDVKLREIYDQKFEVETGRKMASIIKGLKKRYKKNTGNALSLKMLKDPVIRVESTSRVRCWATARCTYKIGNMTDVEEILEEEGTPELEKNFKKFLEQGDLGKKAQNKHHKNKVS
tara:strand:+ start:1552 stop:2100 length:549 start_codon:yes stop_codon:yes gene_type:complete